MVGSDARRRGGGEILNFIINITRQRPGPGWPMRNGWGRRGCKEGDGAGDDCGFTFLVPVAVQTVDLQTY
eukprot:SAG31_NODE_2686_length_5253_cov_84.469926_1_plen_70_part_00